MRISVLGLGLALGLALGTGVLFGQDKETKRLGEAATVFKEIMATPDKAVPENLLAKCECVAVIPHMVKAGFILGGEYGKGVISCRGQKAGDWGPPAFIKLTGGSFGAQIGGQATDLVLLFMNRRGATSLLKNKFKLGADASVAGGPVGRRAEAGTDVQLKAEILAYSRSRGAFAGVSLDGTVVAPDKDAIKAVYKKDIAAADIINGQGVTAPASASGFLGALRTHAPVRSK